jgi:hypothetical protein
MSVINRPYDLNVPKTEITAAMAWWWNLSSNQMKGHRDKYTPKWEWNGHVLPVWTMDRMCQLPRTIHQIWEEEGKPAPQVVWHSDGTWH